jgi:hypothetical protein
VRSWSARIAPAQTAMRSEELQQPLPDAKIHDAESRASWPRNPTRRFFAEHCACGAVLGEVRQASAARILRPACGDRDELCWGRFSPGICAVTASATGRSEWERTDGMA